VSSATAEVTKDVAEKDFDRGNFPASEFAFQAQDNDGTVGQGVAAQPPALAEARAAALKLEKHAYTVSRNLYGGRFPPLPQDPDLKAACPPILRPVHQLVAGRLARTVGGDRGELAWYGQLTRR
jgi:hypothetical protein